MSGGIEFQLGQMTAQIAGLRGEIALVREEGQQREKNIVDNVVRRIDQHDRRDDDRFEAMGSRVMTIERQAHAQGALDQAEQHQTNNRVALTAAVIAALAALMAAVLPLLSHGGH